MRIELNSYKYKENNGWIKTRERQRNHLSKIPGLIEKYEKKMNLTMDEWRRLYLYEDYVDIINTEFMMTPHQKQRIKYIIKELKDLKQLCRNCSYQQIISSIAIYVMRRDKRRFDIDINPFFKTINLTDRKHTGIMENLNEFREKKG